MREREAAEDSAPRGSEADEHFSFVFDAGAARDCARRFQPVHEFDRAVVLDEEPRSDLANGGLYAFREAMDRKQELVLLRLDAVVFRRGFAEMKKAPDLPAEFGKIAILIVGEI